MNTLEEFHERAILIVDNLRSMRDVLGYIFRAKEFKKVFFAGSEKEAIRIINTETIDLILTDWMMPKESGLSFVKTIRAQEPELPIIMVAARSSKEDILESIESGINGYILKPVVPKEIMQKAVQQLKQHKMREPLNETEKHTDTA
jgi:two-component system chemotaxis response regulator CheY